MAEGSIPTNTRRWSKAVLMLAQRLRRWANIKTALGQRLVLVGELLSWNVTDLRGDIHPPLLRYLVIVLLAVDSTKG